MVIDAFYGKISSFFRKQRIQRFIEYFNITSNTRMLDVGGTIFNWTLTDVQPQLFMVNIRPARKGNVHRIVADGCALPFCDNTFDVVFSNSVIEHLSTAEN